MTTPRNAQERTHALDHQVKDLIDEAKRYAAQVEPYPDVPIAGPDLLRQMERQLFDDGDP
jgi:hypothetical protein